MLVAAGANANAKGLENGDTPLHVAAQHSHLGATEALVGHGANVNEPDVRG